jgi:hypothetical protein
MEYRYVALMNQLSLIDVGLGNEYVCLVGLSFYLGLLSNQVRLSMTNQGIYTCTYMYIGTCYYQEAAQEQREVCVFVLIFYKVGIFS